MTKSKLVNKVYESYDLYTMLMRPTSGTHPFNVAYVIDQLFNYLDFTSGSVLEAFAGRGEISNAYLNTFGKGKNLLWNTTDLLPMPNLGEVSSHFQGDLANSWVAQGRWDIALMMFNGIAEFSRTLRFPELVELFKSMRLRSDRLIVESQSISNTGNNNLEESSGVFKLFVPYGHGLRSQLKPKGRNCSLFLNYTCRAYYNEDTDVVTYKFEDVYLSIQDTRVKEFKVDDFNARYWTPCDIIEAASFAGFRNVEKFHVNSTYDVVKQEPVLLGVSSPETSVYYFT